MLPLRVNGQNEGPDLDTYGVVACLVNCVCDCPRGESRPFDDARSGPAVVASSPLSLAIVGLPYGSGRLHGKREKSPGRENFI